MLFASFLESGPPCTTTTTGGWCHLPERSIFAARTGAQQHARNLVSGHCCGSPAAFRCRPCAVSLGLLHISLLPLRLSSNEIFTSCFHCCRLCLSSLDTLALSLCLSVSLALACGLRGALEKHCMFCALRSLPIRLELL